MSPNQLTIEHHGAALHPGAALSILPELEALVTALPADHAGLRLHSIAGLGPLLDIAGPLGRIAADRLGEASRPVRAILFDKSAATNWALGWHQDRTIALRERVETDGFGPWSVKAGITHVEPPFALLAAMLTMRIHLDPVPERNAPLLIAPGSHRLGRIAERDIDASVRAAAPSPAPPGAAMCGSTPRRSFMPRRAPSCRNIAACCRLISRRSACRRVSIGSVSEASSRLRPPACTRTARSPR